MQGRKLLLRNGELLCGRITYIAHNSKRYISDNHASTMRRFIQTSQNHEKVNSPTWPFKFDIPARNKIGEKKTWASYSLPKIKTGVAEDKSSIEHERNPEMVGDSHQQLQHKKRSKRKLRPRKAVITLAPNAIYHLKSLLNQPEPKLIRVGVKNRGCSGLTYDLQYITEPGKFDEIVEQDGVKVVIDSKALFSIVGSEMDWIDDKLSSKFVFKNPNSKGTCGCGESFMV